MKLEGRGIFFSELTKYDVVDFNDKKLGHVGDMLIDKKSLAARGLIVHGSFLEEKLEAVGIINDVDPIIPIDQVDYSRFHEKVVASMKALHQLPLTSRDYQPPEDSFMFSKLKKFRVRDSKKESLGHLTDICFHSDGNKTLIINPGKHVHFGNRYQFIQSREILIPVKFIDKIEDGFIMLNVSMDKLNEHDKIGLHRFIDKDIRALELGFDFISSRYHYYTYSAPLSKIKKHLEQRKEKIDAKLATLKVVQYDPKNDSQTHDLVYIFNEVALTSVDPYEELTLEVARKHFGKGTFVIYLGPKPIGYNILSWKSDESQKIGSIAGIGLHHKQRGKGLSTALIYHAVNFLQEKDDFEYVEADILVNNEPSIGLFTSLGFNKTTDFFLC